MPGNNEALGTCPNPSQERGSLGRCGGVGMPPKGVGSFADDPAGVIQKVRLFQAIRCRRRASALCLAQPNLSGFFAPDLFLGVVFVAVLWACVDPDQECVARNDYCLWQQRSVCSLPAQINH